MSVHGLHTTASGHPVDAIPIVVPPPTWCARQEGERECVHDAPCVCKRALSTAVCAVLRLPPRVTRTAVLHQLH
jgi:hypothetical protein